MAEWLVRDGQGASVVEGSGFCDFAHEMDPRFRIPSADTITRKMMAVCEMAEEAVVKLLAPVEYLCLTGDGWTSKANDSYFVTTGHWIPDDFSEVKSLVLGLAHLPESHTIENIRKKVL